MCLQAPSAHASTHVHLSDGGYLVAWFGGTREGAGDVAIWAARRQGGGGGGGSTGETSSSSSQWSAPAIVAKQSDEAHWNPVLFFVGRVLHLHFKVGDDIDTWRTYRTTSMDEGVTWNPARELVAGDAGGRGCVKNKPLILKPNDGEGESSAAVLLCGASTERDSWRAFVDVSTDGGETFERTPDLHVAHHAHHPGAGVIQPALWRHLARPDAVHMARGHTGGRGHTGREAAAGRYASVMGRGDEGGWVITRACL